jgi:hypothetical protein
MKIFLNISVPPGKCREKDLNWAMARSFHTSFTVFFLNFPVMWYHTCCQLC